MRLIDADELIAKCGNLDTIATIKDIVDQMPTIEIDWRWIPCNERQPDENDWHFVSLDNGRHAFRWYLTPEPYKLFEQIVDLLSRSQNESV